MTERWVVIGYGNELRGDDGVGPRVARAVAMLGLPSVRCCAVHQLTPELAEMLSEADRAIFVDASLSSTGTAEMTLLAPVPVGSGWGHTSDPRWLLALTTAVYGHAPAAWLITVPAANVEYGVGLSAQAERGMEEATTMVRLLASRRGLSQPHRAS
jgi:hydrogenase maturation protease